MVKSYVCFSCGDVGRGRRRGLVARGWIMVRDRAGTHMMCGARCLASASRIGWGVPVRSNCFSGVPLDMSKVPGFVYASAPIECTEQNPSKSCTSTKCRNHERTVELPDPRFAPK